MTATTTAPGACRRARRRPPPPQGGRAGGGSASAAALLYLVLIVIAIIYIFPFLIELSTSFKTETDAATDPLALIPPTWTTAAYTYLFANSDFPLWFAQLRDRDGRGDDRPHAVRLGRGLRARPAAVRRPERALRRPHRRDGRARASCC